MEETLPVHVADHLILHLYRFVLRGGYIQGQNENLFDFHLESALRNAHDRHRTHILAQGVDYGIIAVLRFLQGIGRTEQEQQRLPGFLAEILRIVRIPPARFLLVSAHKPLNITLMLLQELGFLFHCHVHALPSVKWAGRLPAGRAERPASSAPEAPCP